MPALDVPDYLLGYLWDVGPVMSGGMGPVQISHSEIQSWQYNTGIELHPWETQTLRRLSGEYLSELRKAEKPDCPSPWSPIDMSESNRLAVSRKVQNAMRSFMASPEKS